MTTCANTPAVPVEVARDQPTLRRALPSRAGLRDYYEDGGRRYRHVPEYDPVELTRVNLVFRLLPRRSGRSVLDVGCGDGYLLDRLASRGFRNTFGVDLAQSRLDFASRCFLNRKLVQSDVVDLPFADEAFDVVTCVEVLEHVPDPDRSLVELARVSARYVICTTPYCESVSENLCPHCGKGFPPAGHLHRFDEDRFKSMADQAGLRFRRWRHAHPVLEYRRFRLLPPLRWLIQGYYRTSGFIGVLLEKQ